MIFSPRLLLEDDDDFFFSAEEEAECARTLTLSEENRRRRRCLYPSPPTPLPMVVLFLLNFALSRWCRCVEKRHPLSSSSFRRNAALLAENEEEEEEVTKSRWEEREEALATPFPPVLLMLPRTNIFFSYKSTVFKYSSRCCEETRRKKREWGDPKTGLAHYFIDFTISRFQFH